MALTVNETVLPLPNVRIAHAAVTFDSSYATGGEALAASDLGLPYISFILTNVRPSDTGGVDGFVVHYNRSTGKLQAYWVDTTTDGAALAEVANTTDLSGVVVDVLAFYVEGGVASS